MILRRMLKSALKALRRHRGGSRKLARSAIRRGIAPRDRMRQVTDLALQTLGFASHPADLLPHEAEALPHVRLQFLKLRAAGGLPPAVALGKLLTLTPPGDN